MFLAAAAAGPVYKLLGKKDMGTTEFPPIETPLMDGDVAFRQHSGGHTDAPNWPTFLNFASRYVKASAKEVSGAGGTDDRFLSSVDVGQVGRKATCGPIGNRPARRLTIAAQDTILPHTEPQA